MQAITIVSKKTQRAIVPSVPLGRDPPEFPADFFARGQKPEMMIPNNAVTLDDARMILLDQIKKGSLDINLGKLYLYLVLKDITQNLDADWTSFNVQIGSLGTSMSPWGIVTVNQDPNQCRIDGSSKDTSAKKEDDQWMCMYLLAIYRVGKATNKTYQTMLIDQLNRMLASVSKNAVPMVQAMAALDSWPNDTNFCKMVACVDMFFNKFKNHEWAVLRFGTISSRFRDCAALTSMAHYQQLLGINLGKALEWIFVSRVTEEVELILTPNQELDKPDSYMPYLIDLGISKNSPYSSTRNSSWHLFCHGLGALLASRRSVNARHLEAADQSNILINVMLISYVFQTRVTWSKNFVEQGQVDKSDALNDGKKSVLLSKSSLPSTTSADDWFCWMKLNRFELPDDCKVLAGKNAQKLNDSRDGSIGQFLYKRLGN
ncbi:nucleocapsid [Durham virus]|uniref:Nucleoprotein n=1 Tax=Durham virus TaxID=710545 RepID=D6C4E3_9RHAB|nr:nucleocapsid [Durham virus]ADB88758.1 nucleocapsid [Durham virus]